MLSVANIPETIKQDINSGFISASLVSDVFKKVDNNSDKLTEVIEKAKEYVEEIGKKKLTAKLLKDSNIIETKVEELKFKIIYELINFNNEVILSSTDINLILEKQKDEEKIILKNTLTNTNIGEIKTF